VRRRFGRGAFTAIEPFDQVGQQTPEKRIARIAADAADLAAVVDQHEHGREALALDESELRRNGLRDIDPV
jgi:hypothetical protein